MASNCPASSTLPTSVYPQARRDETIVTDYHGIKVGDPYRWLEDPDSEETKEYVNELNNVSIPFIEACPIRQKLKTKLTELWDYPKYGCTSKHGNNYFYDFNSGLQNQSVIYIQKSLESEGKVFLDPNTFSEDGTTAIRKKAFSHDGTILAYGISEKGSDWVTLKFIKVPSGQTLTDKLTNLKFTQIAWTHDNQGVFYSSYPEHSSDTVGTATEKHEYHSLYYHKMGTKQEEDIPCVRFDDEPDYLVSGEVSEDGKYLIVTAYRGTDPTNLIYFYDLEAVNNTVKDKLELTAIIDKFEASFSFIDNDDSTAIFLTSLDCPMFKLIKIDFNTPQKKNWQTLIAENPDWKLDWASVVAGDKLLLCYMEHVKNTLYVHDSKSGELLYQLPLEIGQVTGFFGRKRLSEIFYSFTSFLIPGIIYRYDFSAQSSVPEEYRRTTLAGFDPSKFEIKQVFYSSKDGTKIPMYIVHRKHLELNGQNTVLLSGYGGFNIPLLPYFSISRLLYLRHLNGVFCLANLRGGSEYGERWHEAGMREKKQNVFDDFIAAAEYLIDQKYTNPKRLSIHGGSNGGLLVAVCAAQRPELYGAVLNLVGVLDMLRFHKFTIGGAWIPEYGNPDKAEDIGFIYKYSPLHNLSPPPNGEQLPSMLLMTADHDDRVVPLHSLKYIAQLYYTIKNSQHQTNPILIKVEVKAGHGSGKPTAKIIEELVHMYSYLARVFDLQYYD